MRQRQQAGNATLQVLGAVALLALALGAIGPALDHEPYGAPAPEQAHQVDAAAVECRRQGGDNAGYVQVGGGFVCTDKHGRRHRNTITILHPVEARP